MPSSTSFGLAIGLAACLMLLLYVRYETSYDNWLPNAENTYQFQTYYTDPQTGERTDLQMSSYVVGPAAEGRFPADRESVYVQAGGATVLRNGEALAVENVGYRQRPLLRHRPAAAAAGRPAHGAAESGLGGAVARPRRGACSAPTIRSARR